jgi:hypothetical protein
MAGAVAWRLPDAATGTMALVELLDGLSPQPSAPTLGKSSAAVAQRSWPEGTGCERAYGRCADFSLAGWMLSTARRADSDPTRDDQKITRSWSLPHEGCQLVRRSHGKALLQKVEEGGDAGAQQPPRWIEGPEDDIWTVYITPVHQRASS